MKTSFGNFTSLKSRIALQVARKIAPCNMVFTLYQGRTKRGKGVGGGRVCSKDNCLIL